MQLNDKLLSQKISEYLGTLNDSDLNDAGTTARDQARVELDAFMGYLFPYRQRRALAKHLLAKLAPSEIEALREHFLDRNAGEEE